MRYFDQHTEYSIRYLLVLSPKMRCLVHASGCIIKFSIPHLISFKTEKMPCFIVPCGWHRHAGAWVMALLLITALPVSIGSSIPIIRHASVPGTSSAASEASLQALPLAGVSMSLPWIAVRGRFLCWMKQGSIRAERTGARHKRRSRILSLVVTWSGSIPSRIGTGVATRSKVDGIRFLYKRDMTSAGSLSFRVH